MYIWRDIEERAEMIQHDMATSTLLASAANGGIISLTDTQRLAILEEVAVDQPTMRRRLAGVMIAIGGLLDRDAVESAQRAT